MYSKKNKNLDFIHFCLLCMVLGFAGGIYLLFEANGLVCGYSVIAGLMILAGLFFAGILLVWIFRNKLKL